MNTSFKLISHLMALTLTGALCATSVQAATVEGVTLPDQTTAAGKSLTLNGTGLRLATIMKIKVYVAGLYLETPSKDAKAILESKTVKKMTMNFLRDVPKDKLVDGWQDGLKNNCPKSYDSITGNINHLTGILPDIHKGDSLDFIVSPGRVETVVNGKVAGMIDSAAFATCLPSVWLGDEPPNKELKAGVLGQK